jgi:hypothetical protein
LWLKRHPDDPTKPPEESEDQYARTVIEMLLGFISNEI